MTKKTRIIVILMASLIALSFFSLFYETLILKDFKVIEEKEVTVE